LCRQLKQQRKAYLQARDADLRRRVTEWLAENGGLYSTPQVVEQLGLPSVIMLKNRVPDLYAEIVRRRRVQRQAVWQQRQAFLDKIISENPVPPPSLPQVAANLDCSESHLRAQFPQLSKIIQKWYQLARQREKERAKAALKAALSPEQQPPLLPLQVAQSLGYENANYLIRHFPKLCHRLCQRYEAYKRQMIRTQLQTFLAQPASEPPLTLNRISWQLGYEIDTLRFHCPDLCQLLEERYEAYRAEKFRIAQQRLEALLSGETSPPASVEAVARESGFNVQTVRSRFPDLAKAVTDTYRHYVRQRSRERRQRLVAEVKRITRELYRAGLDPTLGRVAACLPHSRMILATFLQQAWQEARQELGLPA
jgi:AraC-like DNA-binding protein